MLEYVFYDNEKDENKEYVVLLHGLGGSSNIFYKQLRAYREKFKVLAIHLPAHGNSPSIERYGGKITFELCSEEVIKVLKHLKIDKAHFVGVSLGTIVIHQILKKYPEKVVSAVMGGAVTSFSRLAKIFIFYGNLVKSIAPHMWIYKFFARILMPKSNHKESRITFIREAAKMKRKDFFGWYNMMPSVEGVYKGVMEKSNHIKKMYISGSEDHMFINSLKKDVSNDESAEFVVMEKCGHVCNIEKGTEFNEHSLKFLSENSDQKN